MKDMTVYLVMYEYDYTDHGVSCVYLDPEAAHKEVIALKDADEYGYYYYVRAMPVRG